MPHSSIDIKGFREFFSLATGYREPFDWQLEVAKCILEMDRGILSITAETGSGKTEAVVIPSLYRGRQVIVVEPYRALIEDMIDRFKRVLSRLSRSLGVPYSLGVDYGGEHFVYECADSACRELPTRKPFGTDILLTTMDEMLYRLLSVGPERKASLYAVLVRMGTPVVFFDEAHSYSTEAANPLVTLVYEAVSLALYTPVVVASATLPNALKAHLRLLAQRNGLPFAEYAAPERPKKTGKATVHVRVDRVGVGAILEAVEELAGREHRTILVRVVMPERAYEVYASLLGRFKGRYSVGVLHGRMPNRDRARVFKALRDDMSSGEPVILVATPAIEAGVDLDFDAGVIELTPYRSVEQTLGRINRRYEKPGAEAVLVGVEEQTWEVLAPKSYLQEVLDELAKICRGSSKVDWESLRRILKGLDEKYVGEELSTPRLFDTYDAPYSRLLAASFYSLLHLEGTMLEYLAALSKDTYETRGRLDVVVEVEGEPGNYLRIPHYIAEKLAERGVEIVDRGVVPPAILKPHNYVKRSGEEVKVRGLVL